MDLSPKMMDTAKEKFLNGAPSVATSLDYLYSKDMVSFVIGDVNKLSSLLNGKKFDTIVDTFSLCIFPEPSVALRQERESSAPRGKMLLLEHQDSIIGKVLNLAHYIAADVINTCSYDDNVLELLKSAGFNYLSYTSFAGGFLLEVVTR